MHYRKLTLAVSLALALSACDNAATDPSAKQSTAPALSSVSEAQPPFQWQADQFADLRVLRYQVPGFAELPLGTKTLLYDLYQAALYGRDIIWDQNYHYNLRIRHTLEAIVRDYSGDRQSEDWQKFMVYVKRVWFSNGIHHHYSNAKILPDFTFDYFRSLVRDVADKNHLPLSHVDGVDGLLALLHPVMFDPAVDNKKVAQGANIDKVQASAVNFYGPNVTEQDVAQFYAAKENVDNTRPVSWGLNSKLIKDADGKLHEQTWKVGGMYSPALEKVVYWLQQAQQQAQTEQQRTSLAKLIQYYQTGDLKTFDDYNIAWVNDTEANVDVVNGFIEVYNDPLAMRGSFESVVNIKDPEGTRRIKTIADNAQWFEDHSPILDDHKKAKVQGITGKAINVIVEAGDASPSTPIGINLPNANWIRAEYGSKSVNLSNIVHAYDEARGGTLQAFAWDQAEIDRGEKYGAQADTLHTDMHEVIGHASGKINPGVGTPAETLKQYASTLEEARADLVALYYLYDEKLVKLGLMPDLEVGKAAYDQYIRNGLLVQLNRVAPGEDLEEAHMRNRQLIAQWVYQHGQDENVIDKKRREGKTYFVINDYEKLHVLFGDLLREIQRIKSEGDFQAGQALVENYGVKVDPALHEEVLKRYSALHIAPYAGFINPKLTPVYNKQHQLTDITISYPTSFTQQMLDYGQEYGVLPVDN